ncbi:MAG: MerC domain-containing protein [Pseudomonadota bacterium]
MNRLLDVTAISLSGLCFAHCLILPLAAISLPFLGEFAEAEWVHWLFVGMAAPIAMVAIGPVLFEEPRAWLIPALALIGIGLLLAGAMEYADREMDAVLTIAGGVTLAGAHLLNRRRAHKGHRH